MTEGAQVGRALGARLLPYALASFALSALFCLGTQALAPELRPAALFGALAAAVSGALALPAVYLGLARGTNGLLAGFSLGFLARGALVAIGLVSSRARGSAALAYAFSFFALYAVTQAIEIAYVFASSRKRASEVARGAP